MPPNSPAKTDLRRLLRARRNALSAAQRDEFSVSICEYLQSWLLTLDDSMATIAIYQALAREVDLSALLDLDLDFVYPRRVGDGWIDADETEVFERVSALQVLAAPQIDIIFVPALGFDAKANRIGQGGGWYDRVLSRAPHALKIGVAFGCQMIENLPHEAHDMKMDGVVTENGLRFVEREND